MIRVGRTRFTRLSEAESDVKFHPSVLTKNKLHLVHTSRGPYLWAHIQILPSVLHGSLRPRAECHARLAHILESLNKLATHALELVLDARAEEVEIQKYKELMFTVSK